MTCSSQPPSLQDFVPKLPSVPRSMAAIGGSRFHQLNFFSETKRNKQRIGKDLQKVSSFNDYYKKGEGGKEHLPSGSLIFNQEGGELIKCLYTNMNTNTFSNLMM